MLQPILQSLNNKRIVLASTSPRRKLLLENIGLKFEIVASTFEENLTKDDYSSPLSYVTDTALHKVLDVVHKLYGTQSVPPELIIGADTIVTIDNTIIEKPSSREHAVDILTKLSGSTHNVLTSVVLVTPNTSGGGEKYSIRQFHADTEVYMGELTHRIIQAYVDTGEPMDKAGGYGIQALGSTLIKGINGDYFNVIGFPLHQFSKELLDIFPCV